MKYFTILFFFFILYASKAQTDQELIYGTYFGGENVDIVYDIAIDQQGNSIFVGRTQSETGIATLGAYQQTMNGIGDGFVTKFDSDYNLIWSTYFGGEGIEEIFGISVLSDESIIITGKTDSEFNIATSGAYQEVLNGTSDAFIARFTMDGEIIWSTYFGGSQGETGQSIVISDDDDIFFVGGTTSENMATVNSFQEIYSGMGDGLLSKFSKEGLLLWSTYYGGEGSDGLAEIALSDQNELFLIGETRSDTNIATENVYQETYSGSNDCFIAKFTLTGERLWGTYFGGPGFEQAFDIDSDSLGNVIISGYTQSSSGIATPGAHKTVMESVESFLASFNSSGQINWGTYFGGTREEFDGNAIYVNGSDIYFAGRTDSEDGITAGSPYQTEYAGPYVEEYFNSDIYLTKFNSNGQQIWGTYYGGLGSEIVNGIIKIDENKYALGASSGSSGSVVVTPDAFQPENAGFGDGLFAVFDVDLLISVNEIIPGELNVYPNPANNYFIIKPPKTISGNGFVEIYNLEGKRIVVFENYISGNRISLDLAPGMYIVSYRNDNIDFRTKLMVK